MNEEEIKKWTKEHKKEIVQRIITDTKPDNNRLAIFMAGIPGAGKTEFSERTFFITEQSDARFVRLEHDFLVRYIQNYDPEKYYHYRKSGSILVTELFQTCLREGYSFVFDGTLAHSNGLRNIRKSLEKNFKVAVFYIAQDPQMAWSNTLAREVVTKRSIDKEGFIKTTNSLQGVLREIYHEYNTNPGFSMSIYDKKGKALGDDTESIVDIAKYLEKDYTLDINFAA